MPIATLVHIEDDGKSFDVARGDTVTFELARSAGTGYTWALTQADPLVLARQGDRSNEVPSGVPGAQRMDVYRFTANGAGSSTVELSLRREFGSSAPTRTVRVTIRVR